MRTYLLSCTMRWKMVHWLPYLRVHPDQAEERSLHMCTSQPRNSLLKSWTLKHRNLDRLGWVPRRQKESGLQSQHTTSILEYSEICELLRNPIGTTAAHCLHQSQRIDTTVLGLKLKGKLFLLKWENIENIIHWGNIILESENIWERCVLFNSARHVIETDVVGYKTDVRLIYDYDWCIE